MEMKNRCRFLLFCLLLTGALTSCGRNTGSSSATDGVASKPVMPQLASITRDGRLAPVFGSKQTFNGSALDDVGRKGLFDSHDARSNRIALLRNGEDSFAARVRQLEQARKSIRIQALVFSGDESGLYIAEILKKKKAQGLDVRLIVDAPSNLGLQTQWMYFDLKQHGIEVQGYEALYLEWLNEVPIPVLSPARDPEAPNSRYHEKMWIVDGDTDQGMAVVGGLNIANEYFRANPEDPDRTWRDQDIVVKGPVVADMVVAFERNFNHILGIKQSRGVLDTDLYWQATRNVLDQIGKLIVPYKTRQALVENVKRMAETDPGLDFVNARCRFFHSRPRLGESYIKQAYQKLLDNAREEIIICNAYFIPSADFIQAVRRAVGRGVRVMILTNSPETNDLPELTMVGRSYYKKLLAINEDIGTKENDGHVQIWEWHGRRYDQTQKTQGTIHAKYAVFDRRYSLVGSYNLDPRSEKLNSETAMVFESDVLSPRLSEFFYTNDLAFSRQVSVEEANAFQDPTDVLYKLRKEFGDLFEPLL